MISTYAKDFRWKNGPNSPNFENFKFIAWIQNIPPSEKASMLDFNDKFQ
jgi:hypothetical protein